MIYLDHNATTPVRPEARDAVIAALSETGNASSMHMAGRAARRRIEDAREVVGRFIGARAQDVVFTSGGTEANNQALRGCGRARQIVSAIEHDSVLAAAGPDADILPVDGNGVVDLERLAAMLAERGEDTVVSVMLANNETGVLQPVSDVVRLAHDAGALVHVDAVQAVGKMAVSFAETGADMMTISGHKLGAPAGVGALVLRPGLQLDRLICGGGQERRQRAGTENISSISGLSAALDVLSEDLNWVSVALDARNHLETRLLQSGYDVQIFGGQSERLATTCCFGVDGIEAERLLMALDLEGLAVSSGSACSSGKVAPSHVLSAMGVAEGVAKSAVRVSFGWTSQPDDGERFFEGWMRVIGRMRPGIASAA